MPYSVILTEIWHPFSQSCSNRCSFRNFGLNLFYEHLSKRRAGYKRILLGEHGAGKVAVTGIREKDNNGLPRVFRALGQLDSGPYGSAGGDTHQHALALADLPASGKGILIGDRDNLVIDLGIQDGGNKPSADALDAMLTGDAGGKDGGGLRLDGDDADGRIFLPEVAAHTGDGTAGADPCHKGIHLPIGILPDLRGGGGVVGLGVGLIDKLAGDEAVRDLAREFIRFGDGAFHALGAGGEDQLRAIGFHQLAALHAHGLRHDDDDTIAPGGGHRGQADAGIAVGGLDEDGLGGKEALLLGILYHGEGNAVLDGTGGIEVFQLGQKAGLEVILFFKMGELQQGGVADELGGGSVDICHRDAS